MEFAGLSPSAPAPAQLQNRHSCTKGYEMFSLGGAGASENTVEITVQRNCCFVQKSVMAPNSMLAGRTAKQEWVEENGE